MKISRINHLNKLLIFPCKKMSESHFRCQIISELVNFLEMLLNFSLGHGAKVKFSPTSKKRVDYCGFPITSVLNSFFCKRLHFLVVGGDSDFFLDLGDFFFWYTDVFRKFFSKISYVANFLRNLRCSEKICK